MSLSRIAITAITSNTWMIPPAEKTKNPSAQPINKITAIMYNMVQILISKIKGYSYIQINADTMPMFGFE
jgi:hypothetical protein